MSDCLFCKIIAGDIPSDKLYEDENYFVFNDINPQAPNHFLVIPKKHIAKVSEMSPEDNELVGGLFCPDHVPLQIILGDKHIIASIIAGQRGRVEIGLSLKPSCHIAVAEGIRCNA